MKAIQELVAMGESLITHIKTDDILSDFLTKTTSGANAASLLVGLSMTFMMTSQSNRT